jgi:hypothetical protein
MKVTAPLTAAFLSGFAVRGMGIENVPACALNCLLQHIGDTGCGFTDYKCICKDFKFLLWNGGCFMRTCSWGDWWKSTKMEWGTWDLTPITVHAMVMSECLD